MIKKEQPIAAAQNYMKELQYQKLSRSLSRKYLKVPTVSSSQAASSQTTMAAGWV